MQLVKAGFSRRIESMYRQVRGMQALPLTACESSSWDLKCACASVRTQGGGWIALAGQFCILKGPQHPLGLLFCLQNTARLS